MPVDSRSSGESKHPPIRKYIYIGWVSPNTWAQWMMTVRLQALFKNSDVLVY